MNEMYIKKLKELKNEYGINYKAIAGRCGVTNTFVSKWVHQKKLIPVKYYEQIDSMLDQVKRYDPSTKEGQKKEKE